jgi:hypothetical protein
MQRETMDRITKSYLAKHPREKDDLMFVTQNGLPLVRQDVKTQEELLNGTCTKPPSERLEGV